MGNTWKLTKLKIYKNLDGPFSSIFHTENDAIVRFCYQVLRLSTED